jgi:hypothetical protein
MLGCVFSSCGLMFEVDNMVAQNLANHRYISDP